MVRRIKYILWGLLFLCLACQVEALSVSKNELSLEKGKTEYLDLYANTDDKVIKHLEFTLIFTTYDIPANFIVNEIYSDDTPNSITHSINLPEGKSGKILLGRIRVNTKDNPKELSGTININNPKAITINDEVVNLNSQSINVKIVNSVINEEDIKNNENNITEPVIKETKINKSLIDKIESKIVDIDLKDNTYEYDITIDEDILELDLEVIPKDKNTEVIISSQKINELTNNQILITCKNNDIEETYKINVKIEEDKAVSLDDSNYIPDNSYKSKWTVISIVLGVGLLISLLFVKK